MLYLFDQKYNKNINTKKNYCKLKYLFSIWLSVKMSFIPVMQGCIFSIITPVLGVTSSFRNNSDMLICCLKTFIIINNIYFDWYGFNCIIFQQPSKSYFNLFPLNGQKYKYFFF